MVDSKEKSSNKHHSMANKVNILDGEIEIFLRVASTVPIGEDIIYNRVVRITRKSEYEFSIKPVNLNQPYSQREKGTKNAVEFLFD